MATADTQLLILLGSLVASCFRCTSSSLFDFCPPFHHHHHQDQPGHGGGGGGSVVKPPASYSWPSRCFPTPACDAATPYRTLDGSCNNLRFPAFGMLNTSLVRMLTARYSDGTGALPVSVSGGPLPLARSLRTLLFPNVPRLDSVNSLAVMTWGQLIAHDVSLINSGLAPQCCTQRPVAADCLVINIPPDDQFYSQFNVTCFGLRRSETVNTNKNGCIDSPLQQKSLQTHFLDLSMVYGRTREESDGLRSFKRGQLRSREDEDGREFLPNVDDARLVCPFANTSGDTCFLAGDPRVNQQPPLSSMQTVLLREHNLLCDQLFLLNPQWSDQRLFQEARRLLIAQYQHITYAHYLPILIGDEPLGRYELRPRSSGYGFAYDEGTNPGTLNMFTTAAYRALHTIIPAGILFPPDDSGTGGVECVGAELRTLSSVLNRPDLVVEDGNYDGLLRALAAQPAEAADMFYNEQVTNQLFAQPGAGFGMDLPSMDIERGRDHGLPAYNAVRKACGLPRAKRFEDFQDTMEKQAWERLSDAYAHVDDVDLYVGGLSERLVPGALVGPVFLCLIAEQFRRWRSGDRYFYEFGGLPGSFRLDQLDEIRSKSSLALLLCRNSDHLKSMPRDAFSQPSSRNALVKCKHIPSLNLRLWKEPEK